MVIEVFKDMIVIHSPDNSENNQFKGILGFQEEEHVRKFIFNLYYNWAKKTPDISYNEEKQ